MASAARKLLTIDDARAITGYGEGSLRKRVALKLIPARRVQGRLVFQRRDLLTAKARRDRWMESLSAELRAAYVKACKAARD